MSAHFPSRLLLLLAMSLGGVASAAPTCPPAAQIEGDEPLATAIREMLAKRGIGAEIELPCAAVHAIVRETPDGVSALVRDETGRERSYELRDRDTAVTVVESWARHDLEGALLAPRRGPTPAPADRGGAERRPVSIAMLAGAAYGNEGSVWTDVGIAGCVRFEGVCAGLLVRASRDSAEFGDSDRYGTNRSAADVLATVDMTRRVGRFAIGGGLGFGAGWQQSLQKKSQDSGGSDGQDFGGLRMEARATGALVLARQLDLELVVAAGISPLASTRPLREPNATIAAEPAGFARATLGLRFGGP